MKKQIILYCFLLISSVDSSLSQTIFTELKTDEKRADTEFDEGNYKEALNLYLEVINTNPLETNILKKIARTYNELKAPVSACEYLLKYSENVDVLTEEEMLMLGNYLTNAGNYKLAIHWYNQYKTSNPTDVSVAELIWQLENRSFLYEDSIFYKVQKLPFNSDHTEFGVSLTQKGIIYLSDNPEYGGRKIIDGRTDRNFLRWFNSEKKYDSLLDLHYYEKPKEAFKNIKAKYHKGKIFITENGKKIFYTANGEYSKITGKSQLEIFLVNKENDKWSNPLSLPFNSNSYSTTQPFFDTEEQKLYFSSDMPEGHGGFDIYYSKLINGSWSKPVNLGPQINTSGNESYPFKAGNSFYFTSDGQPGLGGMDIFNVLIIDGEYSNLKNLGYPINTNFDDFGLILSKNSEEGYFSSNRNNQLLNDDIYHVEISLQSFPLIVSGLLSVKDLNNIQESTALLRDASMVLIDKDRRKVVSTSFSDNNGRFEIDIPYDGNFFIKVSDKQLGEALVNIDIPRKREELSSYKIVIVKELFSTKKSTN